MSMFCNPANNQVNQLRLITYIYITVTYSGNGKITLEDMAPIIIVNVMPIGKAVGAVKMLPRKMSGSW